MTACREYSLHPASSYYYCYYYISVISVFCNDCEDCDACGSALTSPTPTKTYTDWTRPRPRRRLKVLDKNCKVGFTSAPAWLCYSPCKNNAQDAAAMARKGVPGGSAVTAEADQYNANAQLLRIMGCTVGKAQTSHWLGIPASLGPAIVFDPSFAIFPGQTRSSDKI